MKATSGGGPTRHVIDLDDAVLSGSVPMMEYAVEDMKKHLPITIERMLSDQDWLTRQVDRAACTGSIEAVQWLVAKGGRVTLDALVTAEAHNHDALYGWLAAQIGYDTIPPPRAGKRRRLGA